MAPLSISVKAQSRHFHPSTTPAPLKFYLKHRRQKKTPSPASESVYISSLFLPISLQNPNPKWIASTTTTTSPLHHLTTLDDDSITKRGKKRGSYNCSRCGQPKKGHVCHLSITTPTTTTTTDSSSAILTPSLSFPTPSLPPPPRNAPSHLRRALSFDEDAFAGSDIEEDPLEISLDSGESVVFEVFRRLPPTSLLTAAKVCKGWRDCSKKVWRAVEELRLVVPVNTQVGFVGSVLQKCSSLVRLSLSMESDMDATMLACIAFSCPNLESMEIRMLDKAINRITGEELGRLVAEKRLLSTLKIEGCSNLGHCNLSSPSLSTLWLSDLHSLSKMVFNCVNLKEISLDFSRQENDSTDLATVVGGLGRTCPRLRNIHIASIRLSNAVVLSLADANLSGLRMLSLLLGSEITDASVAAISSSYPDLELLDLSGSSISDSGIGMICNELAESLTRLLLALCPNITSSGVQFATAQLPFLELMDCGKSIRDPDSQHVNEEFNNENPACEPNNLQRTPKSKLHLICQKLIIKHARLKKLSLWGCSGLDGLYLNCPLLNDLNLNTCSNLHPERLLLQCPSLRSVHASGCQDKLIRAIQSQVCHDPADFDDHFPCKRFADGSKRIRVPNFVNTQLQAPDDEKRRKLYRASCTVHFQ